MMNVGFVSPSVSNGMFLPASVMIDAIKEQHEYFRSFTKDTSLEWLQKNGHITLKINNQHGDD
jgi:hypothetical protein